MARTFCTIVTGSHIGTAYALAESIKAIDRSMTLNVLIADDARSIEEDNERGVKLYAVDDLAHMPFVHQIIDKYASDDPDKVRWSLKSVFIAFLLKTGYEKVIFTDPDTWYCSDYRFLFDKLDHYKVILTPHWRNHDPTVDKINFDLLFVEGIFNAGFFGASSRALPVLEWWAKACLDACEKTAAKGKYVDQSYLNLMPVYFDGVGIVRHRGCNLANWNLRECKRTLAADGTVLINDTWPVVFIHFTASTIQGIDSGKDALLAGYLQAYRECIARNAGQIARNRRIKSNSKKRNLVKRIMRRVKRLINGR